MLSLIVAVSKNNVIGKDNALIWHLPEDLKHFKEITSGKTIIMGRKTFESLGRILPKRKHIILCKSDKLQIKDERVTIIKDLSELDKYINDNEEHFVIGGASIYKLLLNKVKKMYITRINEFFEGDTYFPEFDEKEWEIVKREKGIKNEQNPYDYEYIDYVKLDKKSNRRETMITFTGISLKNENYEVHAGDKKSFVLEALGIDPGELIPVNADVSSIRLEKVFMAELTGKCKLLFEGDTLYSISFTPTLGEIISEYRKECGEWTRLEYASCVDQGYKQIIHYLDMEGLICCDYCPYYHDMRRVYKSRDHVVFVGIEREWENVSVVTGDLRWVKLYAEEYYDKQ